MDSESDVDLLRFITCGSVDDGKSTLIGRLLYETGQIFDDQLAALRRESANRGPGEVDFDLSLLTDGLQAEREQGITIDVAFRHFRSPRRAFIVADTPGHEQYTRNMVTGASTADAAVLLIDARLGLLRQTFRHAYIVSMLGVKELIVCINKIDAVSFDQKRFEDISNSLSGHLKHLGIINSTMIPVSALLGDNVTTRSKNTDWYTGPTLLEHLEQCEPGTFEATSPFRLAVQMVSRDADDTRSYAGRISSGKVRLGDPISVWPRGETSHVVRISTFDGEKTEAIAGESVSLVFRDHIDVARGDLVSSVESTPTVTENVHCQVIWMSETPLIVGRRYLAKIGSRTVDMKVTAIDCVIDPESLVEQQSASLVVNQIARVSVHFDSMVAVDQYSDCRDTGSFIVIDKYTFETVGAGLIRATSVNDLAISRQTYSINRSQREAILGQRSGIVWFTGMSGAGKSTLADAVEQKLSKQGFLTYVLDGDNLRFGLNRDLNFSVADRAENVRRVAEVAALMADAGLIVLVALISPFEADRAYAREIADGLPFIEVFVDASFETLKSRDVKGLYQRIDSEGLLNPFGIGRGYEVPSNPNIRIDTSLTSVESAAKLVVEAADGFWVLDPDT